MWHPNIKLDEFDFNVVGIAADYTFANFNPTSWTVLSPGSATGAGAGGSTFTFKAVDSPPGVDVTNSVNLTFDMTKVAGSFLVSDFLNAPIFSGAASMA